MKNLIKWTFPAMLAALVFVPAASADIELTSGNASASIDPYSQAGVHAWSVDGVNQLFQEWFWYADNTGGQSSVDTISVPIVVLSGSNGASITYNNGSISVVISYTLLGGQAGTGQADLSEIVRVDNLTNAPIQFNFFQYSDFDLNGLGGDDTVNILGSLHNVARQTGNGLELSETVVGPSPNGWEANFWPNTLDSLNGGVAYDLNNVASAGPGDVTWAFQWDRTIAANGTFLVSKDKRFDSMIVAAPGAVLLGTIGLGLIAWLKRRL